MHFDVETLLQIIGKQQVMIEGLQAKLREYERQRSGTAAQNAAPKEEDATA